MKLLKLIIILICPILFSNCEKKEECVEYKTASVIGIQAPSNAVVGEVVSFDVQMEIPNGCGEFDRFITTSKGTNVKVIAISRHSGCNCATGPKIIRSTYTSTWTTANQNASIEFLNSQAETDSEVDSFLPHYIRILSPNGK